MRRYRPASTLFLSLTAAALLAGCGQKASESGASDMAADTSSMSGMSSAGEQAAGGLAALIGTHTSPGGSTLAVDSDGSFTVSEGDSVAVHGHMTANGDTVTITDDYCKDQTGVYVVRMGSSGPEFTLVSDPCADRRADLAGDTTAADSSGMSGGQ